MPASALTTHLERRAAVHSVDGFVYSVPDLA